MSSMLHAKCANIIRSLCTFLSTNTKDEYFKKESVTFCTECYGILFLGRAVPIVNNIGFDYSSASLLSLYLKTDCLPHSSLSGTGTFLAHFTNKLNELEQRASRKVSEASDDKTRESFFFSHH